MIEELKNRSELLKKMPRRAVCAEIGVFGANFSEEIIRDNNPREFHLIDPWKHETSGPFSFADENYSQDKFDEMYSHINKTLGSLPEVVVHRDYSWSVLEKFSDAYFDWVYLDACHWYEEVKRDLEVLYRKVKPNGFICGHDYQIERRHQGSGVIRAVNEMINEGRAKMCYIDIAEYVSYGLKRI